MSNIVEVNDSNFDAAVGRNDKPVLVDFWAPWCGPCKTVGPMLEAAVTAAKGAVKMAKVNVDDSPETAARMGIRSIPTLALFREGGVVARQTGAGSLGQLRAFVKGNL